MTMTKTAQEIVQIFTELSPESQDRFLMFARIAHVSEQAVKKSVIHALKGEDVIVTKPEEDDNARRGT